MNYPVIVVPFLPVSAMALFPFILVKKRSYELDAMLMQHEKIHLQQEIELLVLPFYILYLTHYLVNLIRYKNHEKAYLQNMFEQEAYKHDKEEGYLVHRRFCAWMPFMR
ncbi:MAG: hypothetical protein ACOH2A_02745 [Sphingobacteriaceae bacterium]